jgi:hypothetical protein
MTTKHILGDQVSLAQTVRALPQLSSARAVGVVSEVRLRSVTAAGDPSAVHTLRGAWYLSLHIDIEGTNLEMHGVFSQEQATGMVTCAGELLDAQCVLVTIHAEQREPKAAATLQMHAPNLPRLQPSAQSVAEPAPPAPDDHRPESSSAAGMAKPAEPSTTGVAAAAAPMGSVLMPARPMRRHVEVSEAPMPEAGDLVDHFAFGRCEVVKSDGDRLHLRLPKDGRTKEIALEMLRVRSLDEVEGKKLFRLERKA